MLENLLTDENKTGGSINVGRQKDAKNTMNGTSEKRENFKEKKYLFLE